MSSTDTTNNRKAVEDLAERVLMHRSTMGGQQGLAYRSVIQGGWEADELRTVLGQILPSRLQVEVKATSYKLGAEGTMFTSVQITVRRR